MIVGADPSSIVSMAERYAVPAIYFARELPMAGGLMSYGTDLAEVFREVGKSADLACLTASEI
jgi:putative ABC transport system substrate-binding protein